MLAVAALAMMGAACDGGTTGGTQMPGGDDGEGGIILSLTAAPADVACLDVSVIGSRAVERRFALAGAAVTFTIDRLPIGLATVDASAFAEACPAVAVGGVSPRFVAEAPQQVFIRPGELAHVTLRMVRNGRIQVGVDFEGNPFDPRDEATLTPLELLGKRLFEDTNLSEPVGQACASCHVASLAYTGNNGSRIAAVSLGSRPEVFGGRNTPTAKYMALSPVFGFEAEVPDDADDADEVEYTPVGGQFWDGRASTLEEQAKGPFLNPREMNNPSQGAVIAKVATSTYASLFRQVFGDDSLVDVAVAYQRMVEAIAAFERTPRFLSFSSRFDDYLRGQGDLTDQELRGFALFKDPDKGNCIACHAGEPDSRNPEEWLFTDFTYDNLGVPRNPAIPDNADPAFYDLGLCRQPGIEDVAPAGFDVEGACGAFKVPTLRNVAVTAPYMHNGFFARLRDVVRFYVTRDTNPELWYPTSAGGVVRKLNDLPAAYQGNVNTDEVPYDRHPGESPRLDDTEIDDLVAFLGTLTDR